MCERSVQAERRQHSDPESHISGRRSNATSHCSVALKLHSTRGMTQLSIALCVNVAHILLVSPLSISQPLWSSAVSGRGVVSSTLSRSNVSLIRYIFSSNRPSCPPPGSGRAPRPCLACSSFGCWPLPSSYSHWYVTHHSLPVLTRPALVRLSSLSRPACCLLRSQLTVCMLAACRPRSLPCVCAT